MILRRELGNHWASQAATQPATGYQGDIIITRKSSNKSNREYNTDPREIVSYNNGDALRTLIRIRNYSTNPMSVAGILYRSRIESFSSCTPSPHPPASLPTKYSHSRGMGSISREKQNLRVPETNLVAAAPFGISTCRCIFARIIHPFENGPILQVFMSRVLHKGSRDKSVNVRISGPRE